MHEQHRTTGRLRHEHGTVTLVMGVAVVVFAALGMALATLGGAVLAEARVSDAADAVALAGALGGRNASGEVATRNGVELVAWRERGDSVEVRVRRGSVAATATAQLRTRSTPITVDLLVPVEDLP